MDTCLNVDHNFEPRIRARSNTWPLHPNRELQSQSDGSPQSENPNVLLADQQITREKEWLGLTAKKIGSRRNAWGNLSYADLITKAIQASPDKRLTLSQIYDWMVQTVPYFKDKGDSTSSAGWKNSIRHNLSLHNRFMRIQNEGTGKSSWWVINPDAKPGKTHRRRAGSMETKTYEKKRGRVRKKTDTVKVSLDTCGSPIGGDNYFEALGFGDFRSRASSNASSCGHLSPIQALVDSDIHDNQVLSMSPSSWGTSMDEMPVLYHESDNFSNLLDSLVGGMKLSSQDSFPSDSSSMDIGPHANGLNMNSYRTGLCNDFKPLPQSYMTSIKESINESVNDATPCSNLPSPPPYHEVSPNIPTVIPSHQLHAANHLCFSDACKNANNAINSAHSRSPNLYPVSITDLITNHRPSTIKTKHQLAISFPEQLQQNCAYLHDFSSQVRSKFHQTGPQCTAGHCNERSCMGMSGLSNDSTSGHCGSSSHVAGYSYVQQQHPHPSGMSILREALTRDPTAYHDLISTCQYSMSVVDTCTLPASTSSSMKNVDFTLTSLQQLQDTSITSMRFSSAGEQNCSANYNMLNHRISTVQYPIVVNKNVNRSIPLDIDMESFMSVDNECDISGVDVDQVIKQELSLEGSLDFNFDNVNITPISMEGWSIVR